MSSLGDAMNEMIKKRRKAEGQEGQDVKRDPSMLSEAQKKLGYGHEETEEEKKKRLESTYAGE